MPITNFEWVCILFTWWLCGFIPGIWTASASRRNFNRWGHYPRQLCWSDLLMPAWMSIGGPLAGLIHIVVAIIFELGERHWFDFMDRPIFPKKDK